MCLECGNVYIGPEAPSTNCPVCDHPQAYRAIYKKTY
ncbi:rubredoxin-like domain-containing protein [endosymbiont 'TC1' of Trimyema compressum]